KTPLSNCPAVVDQRVQTASGLPKAYLNGFPWPAKLDPVHVKHVDANTKTRRGLDKLSDPSRLGTGHRECELRNSKGRSNGACRRIWVREEDHRSLHSKDSPSRCKDKKRQDSLRRC